MPAFVIGPDGDRYGPASELTIRQWVLEGRVVAETLLEDKATGETKPAKEWDYLQVIFNEDEAEKHRLADEESQRRYDEEMAGRLKAQEKARALKEKAFGWIRRILPRKK